MKTLDKLNSQASLEKLASYITRVARQAEIIDDDHTVTDSTWSSSKVEQELENLGDTLNGKYVEIERVAAEEGNYIQVVDDPTLGFIAKSTPMVFETDPIDWSN